MFPANHLLVRNNRRIFQAKKYGVIKKLNITEKGFVLLICLITFTEYVCVCFLKTNTGITHRLANLVKNSFRMNLKGTIVL